MDHSSYQYVGSFPWKCVFAAACALFGFAHAADTLLQPAAVTLVADGIPGAGAICQIGTFQLGGPFPNPNNPSFFDAIKPGAILDKNRLLVASASNFGEALQRTDEAPGAILSIDPRGNTASIPADFAEAGDQVSILGGRVMLFSANNAAFLNSIFSPNAATAAEVAVSNPTGISLNNAFGRPWFASAPFGDGPFGTISVIDPGGMPFAHSPDLTAGGVFAGAATNRNPASPYGLVAPALATSLLTKSPDQSGRAVFAAALADGSVVQIHVQDGVDLLAPPGTFTPIHGVGPAAAVSTDPHALNRVGIAFNWVPSKVLYIADPLANRIVALDLDDDGTLFTASTPRYLTSSAFSIPVDITPTIGEGAARNFASNTILGGGSDLYVLNRGNNSIVRITQAGRVLAMRSLNGAVPGMRVAGIATSNDGRTIYVTATTPSRSHGGGVVLSISAFGQGTVTASLTAAAEAAGAHGLLDQGAFLFAHEHGLIEGVGPLFNGRACADCHDSPIPGGMGTDVNSLVTRFARVVKGVYRDVYGGPIARVHSIMELGADCNLQTGVPPTANVTSVRSAFTLRGSALIDTILDFEILKNQALEPSNVRGKANVGPDGRVGHFGWKAQQPTLIEFIAEAMKDEMGVTNPLDPLDNIIGCGANLPSLEADAVEATSLVAFLDSVDPPVPTTQCLESAGATVFANIGCADCHTPALPGPGSPTSAEIPVHLYSDLLIHNMGPDLDDGIVQGDAGTSEFRTAPLWRVSDRARFLHNGSANSLPEAIEAHGGQAAEAKTAFDALTPADQEALLSFLS
jgi:hypothetical protein